LKKSGKRNNNNNNNKNEIVNKNNNKISNNSKTENTKNKEVKPAADDTTTTSNATNIQKEYNESVSNENESVIYDNTDVEVKGNEPSTIPIDNTSNEQGSSLNVKSIDSSSKNGSTGSTVATVGILLSIFALFVVGGIMFIRKKRNYEKNIQNKGVENVNNDNYYDNNYTNENQFIDSFKENKVVNETSNGNVENSTNEESDHGIINAFHDLIMDSEKRESTNVTLIIEDNDEKPLRK